MGKDIIFHLYDNNGCMYKKCKLLKEKAKKERGCRAPFSSILITLTIIVLPSTSKK
jgi:hypothetical protein